MKDTRERAVLLQSAHHQELIREAFPDGAVGDLDGTFGENITVTGGCSRTICVGDVFSAEGSPLELQVTHPCRPCSAIDTRFGTKPGVQGARHFCLMKTSRGWFCRVLTPGPLRAEGTLRLTRRPHPEWSLARIGTLLYGSAGPAYWWKPTWSGTDAELAEAAALPELGRCEWRDEVEALAAKKRDAKAGVLSHWRHAGFFGVLLVIAVAMILY